MLRSEGYWASYNRAFYPEIFNLSGAPGVMEDFGGNEWFTHDRTPRARIMRRDHVGVRDLATLLALMRYNDWENDPLAVVEGCHPDGRTPAGSIANRMDLARPGDQCDFAEHDWMVVPSG